MPMSTGKHADGSPLAFIERFSQGNTSTLAEESQSMLDKISRSRRAAASFYPLFLADRLVRASGHDSQPEEVE
jgi:hypothetical protein